jgi:hypothetical protein
VTEDLGEILSQNEFAGGAALRLGSVSVSSGVVLSVFPLDLHQNQNDTHKNAQNDQNAHLSLQLHLNVCS